MTRIPYADLPEAAKEKQRAHVRKSLKQVRLRRIDVYASSPAALAAAAARMPPGLPLREFLSQQIDLIAAGKLVPTPPRRPKQ